MSQLETLPPLSAARRERFLRAYADSGNVTAAAKAAGISRLLHYRGLNEDPLYRAAFHEAHREVFAKVLAGEVA